MVVLIGSVTDSSKVTILHPENFMTGWAIFPFSVMHCLLNLFGLCTTAQKKWGAADKSTMQDPFCASKETSWLQPSLHESVLFKQEFCFSVCAPVSYMGGHFFSSTLGRIIKVTQEVIDYRTWIKKKWGNKVNLPADLGEWRDSFKNACLHFL